MTQMSTVTVDARTVGDRRGPGRRGGGRRSSTRRSATPTRCSARVAGVAVGDDDAVDRLAHEPPRRCGRRARRRAG